MRTATFKSNPRRDRAAWLLAAIGLIAFNAAAQQYAIPWFKIAGGGGMQSTGGVYALSGTIGQTDAGRVAYTNAYRIEGGFWAIAIQQLGYPPLNITRADTNYFVSWQTIEPGLILQQAPATGVSNRYYRLRRP